MRNEWRIADNRVGAPSCPQMNVYAYKNASCSYDGAWISSIGGVALYWKICLNECRSCPTTGCWMNCPASCLMMMGCVVNGESVWCAVVNVEILINSSVESGSASVSACGDVWKARGWGYA